MTLRTLSTRLILFVGALLASTLCLAQTIPADFDKTVDQAVGDHIKVRQILTDLQRSVANHNPSGVAALVHYPIKVNPGKKPFLVKNQKAFVKEYDAIITPDISAAILKQKYETLFINTQGAMIGDGEVWITGFCTDKTCKQSDIKIGTIQGTNNLKP
jgi:hypothetical protein